jgi:putative sterol carrier protein
VADKHPFLSDEWFAEVERLVATHGDQAAPAHANVLVNLTITDTPFGDERQLHMGAKEGQGAFAKRHADGADVTLTTDYATAKDVFVSGNPQAGMQAFMAGKVKVQGDITKLMALQAQSASPDPHAAAVAQAIKDLTAP